MIVLLALVLYAAAGIAIAAAFLVFGVTRVLPEPAPVTLGARIVLFPGAAALWLRAHPLVEILPMRRSQRSVHRAFWPILALAVALGLAMALALRPPPDVQAPQVTEGLKP